MVFGMMQQRLSYDAPGIARLCDWLLPTGHCFQEDVGPDLALLRGLLISCMGVWGDLNDVTCFLKTKLGLRATVVREVRSPDYLSDVFFTVDQY
jgi:hypothetical protein